jgi:hypothetical protein
MSERMVDMLPPDAPFALRRACELQDEAFDKARAELSPEEYREFLAEIAQMLKEAKRG